MKIPWYRLVDGHFQDSGLVPTCSFSSEVALIEGEAVEVV
jgi:hypothetical protein